MQYKIGVFGSAEGNFEKIITVAHTLGEELGKQRVIVITGASTGIPNEVARTAKQSGAILWGYSPAINLQKQEALSPGCDSTLYDKLFYIPKDYEFASSHEVCRKYRNVTSTANCDAAVIVSGRWGTMNEFTNLYDMGKIIGVLTGTGGIADELPTLMKKISKKSKAIVVFSNSPQELVQKVLNELSGKTR